MPSIRPVVLRRLGVVAVALLLASCSETSLFNFPDRDTDTRKSGAWVKEGVTVEQRQQDIRDCYAMARAQVERDRRIDQNIDAGRSSTGSAQATENLMQSMDSYGYEQRKARLYTRCMQDKGYVRK